MKIGIIIIFHNNESQIDKGFFVEQINLLEEIELCLVDNYSKDNTLTLLEDIKESSVSNVSIVQVKKKVSEEVAKRAGARFIFNKSDLKHIGFVNVNALHQNGQQLNTLIKCLSFNQEFILNFNLKTIEDQDVKQTLFQSVFSVVDYLKKISTCSNLKSLNTVFSTKNE